MRKTLAILACFAVVLLSCGKKEGQAAEAEPSDLVPREKMVQVLADVHLLEAMLGLRNVMPATTPHGILPHDPSLAQAPPGAIPASGEPAGYYDIFKKYGVTRSEYERTMKWYTAHAQELTVLYDDVITELTQRQVKEQAVKTATPSRKDQPQQK